ncbi:MAG: PilZ domain-containing protein [Deltaproteobacteria bacterium]
MRLRQANEGQREYPRAPLPGVVRLYDWGRPFDGQAAEIGGGGLFVHTEATISEGSLLTVRVSLPASRSFTVLGRVVRTVRGGWARLRRAGLAVQFVDLAAPDRRAILDYVARHEFA